MAAAVSNGNSSVKNTAEVDKVPAPVAAPSSSKAVAESSAGSSKALKAERLKKLRELHTRRVRSINLTNQFNQLKCIYYEHLVLLFFTHNFLILFQRMKPGS